MSTRFVSALLAVVCLATAANAAYLGGVHDIPAFGGIHCANVAFETDFGSIPNLQVSVDHRTTDHSGDIYHDAVSHWIVSVSSTGFRACVRETGQHDDAHDLHLHFTWLAFTDELATGSDSITVGSSKNPSCKDIPFGTTFGGDVADVHAQVTLAYNSESASATAWIEEIYADRATVCTEAFKDNSYTGTATVHVAAYQKNSLAMNPVHAGEVRFPSWDNEGDHTSCAVVTFDTPLDFTPSWIIASINHRSHPQTNVHHATTVWVEQFNAVEARFCAAELEQWNDSHDDNLHVDFLMGGSSDLDLITCPVVTVTPPPTGQSITESTDGDCLCLEFDCSE